jgi:hypothetical protein
VCADCFPRCTVNASVQFPKMKHQFESIQERRSKLRPHASNCQYRLSGPHPSVDATGFSCYL